MSAAMRLTILISLLTVTACSDPPVFSTTKAGAVTTTAASQVTSSPAPSSTVKTITVTSRAQTTTTHPNTTDVASTALKTTKTNETSPSNTTLDTTATQTSNQTASHKQTSNQTASHKQTSNQTASHKQTVPSAKELVNVTAGTNVNATSPDLLTSGENDSLAANPGLVAILCIFCIVVTLALVVIALKCIQSPRANFERLEDTPMGNVNEQSPFAHYSKREESFTGQQR